MIRLIASVLLTLVLLAPALFAGGFSNTGIGVKATGMGGAFRAIADDWTAAYYNPAGYAFIYDNQLGGNSGFMHHRHELTPNYRYTDNYGSVYENGIYNDQLLYNEHEISSLPSAGFLVRMPVMGETVFGLSAYQPFDNYLSWKVYEPLLVYNDSVSMKLPTDQIKSDLDVVAFQLTASREFMEDKLAIGVGLQLLRADLFLRNLVFRDNPMESPLSDRPYDQIAEFATADGSGWGFGFNAGMLWKVNEKLDVALTAKVPFKITISGDAELDYVMPKNNAMLNESNPESYIPGETGYLFVGGQYIPVLAEFETELKMPASFGIGLAYDLTEKLTVSLDAEYTLWSSFEGFEFTYSNFRAVPDAALSDETVSEWMLSDLTFPVEWDNAGSVMLGASYIATDYMTLLGGVSATQSPTRSSNELTPLFVDPGDTYGFSGGVQFHIRQWDLGLVSSYYHTPDDQISAVPLDVNDDGIDDTFPGTYKAGTYETVLSVNYRF